MYNNGTYGNYVCDNYVYDSNIYDDDVQVPGNDNYDVACMNIQQ